jgi:hypothetical protein
VVGFHAERIGSRMEILGLMPRLKYRYAIEMIEVRYRDGCAPECACNFSHVHWKRLSRLIVDDVAAAQSMCIATF